MSRFIPRTNLELNYFNSLEDNIVKGHNGINSAFYVVQPENIESTTDRMKVYRMNELCSIINNLNENFSMKWYCLQSTFDFSYEESRLDKIASETKDNKFIKKTAEVYRDAYINISDRINDFREKTYLIVINSEFAPAKIKNWYEMYSNTFYRAGLRLVPASKQIIQKFFNELFSLPENHNDFFIRDQEIEFKNNKYCVTNYFKNADGEIEQEESWNQIINIKQTSQTFRHPLDAFWLSNLFEINDVFISFEIDTLPEKARDKFIESLKSDFISVRQYGKRRQIKNERIAFTRELIENLINDIVHGYQDVKLVTLLIKIKAPTRKKLRTKFEEVKRELDKMGLVYGNINFRQKEAIELLQPFRVGHNKGMIGIQKDIEMAFPTDAIANAYPFTQTSLFQKDGGLIAISTQNAPIIFNLSDRTKAINGNMIALGTSGSRKSTFARCLILGNILNPKNQQTVVVDLENEYVQLAKNFNQQVIKFTRDADLDAPTINIFQIPQLDTWNEIKECFEKEPTIRDRKNAFVSQVSYILNTLKIILSRERDMLSTNEITLLEAGIKQTYSNFKINNSTNFNAIPNNKWPTLDNLFDYLIKLLPKLSKKDIYSELEDCKKLIKLIRPFTKGEVYDGVFNKFTNVKVDEKYKLCVFDLHGLLDQDTPDEIKTAMLMATMRFCNNIMLQQRKRYPNEKDPNAKHITFIFDEFHKFVNNRYPQGLELLSSMYSQLRKYYSQIVVLTQSLATFTKAENEDIKRYLTQMLQNSQYKLILGMGEEQMRDLNEQILYDTSRLTDGERMFLATSTQIDGGKFVLYLSDKERIAGRIYSAYTNALSDYQIKVPFEKITEPIQLWQKQHVENGDMLKS